MTVMNDRSQGGSVLKEGRIEIMQNRITKMNDYRGRTNPLNDKDEYGNSIHTFNTYYL